MDGGDINLKGNIVDRESQAILWLLKEEGNLTAPDLARRVGLDQSTQVHYRVKNYLGPTSLGLVAEDGTESRSGSIPDATVYTLTDDGQEFIRAHENRFTQFYTMDELRDAINEAWENSKSAKSSIRRYGQKYARLMRKYEDLKEEVERMNISEDVEHMLDHRTRSLRDDLESLQSDVDGISKSIADLRGTVADLESRIDRLVDEHNQAMRGANSAHERLSEFESRIDSIENRVDENSEGLDDRGLFSD